MSTSGDDCAICWPGINALSVTLGTIAVGLTIPAIIGVFIHQPGAVLYFESPMVTCGVSGILASRASHREDMVEAHQFVALILAILLIGCSAPWLQAGCGTVAFVQSAVGVAFLAVWAHVRGLSVGAADGRRMALAELGRSTPVEVDRDLLRGTPVAPDGMGHIYVIRFGSNAVKVGLTNDPHRRLREHHRDASAYGVPITGVWMSKVHTGHEGNERRLIAHASRSCPRKVRNEYFPGADYDALVLAAQELTGEVPPPRRPEAEIRAEFEAMVRDPEWFDAGCPTVWPQTS